MYYAVLLAEVSSLFPLQLLHSWPTRASQSEDVSMITFISWSSDPTYSLPVQKSFVTFKFHFVLY